MLIAGADECRLWMIVMWVGLECDIAGKKKILFGPVINILTFWHQNFFFF